MIIKEKFPRIMGYYFEDTAVYLDTITEGLRKHDAAMIVPAAHTIKSSSWQVGAMVLSQMAYELETAAKLVVKSEKDFAEIISLASGMKDIFERTRTQIETALQEQAV